jgi:hypothetical protein
MDTRAQGAVVWPCEGEGYVTHAVRRYLRAAIALLEESSEEARVEESEKYCELSKRDQDRLDPIFDEVRGKPFPAIIERYWQLIKDGWDG